MASYKSGPVVITGFTPDELRKRGIEVEVLGQVDTSNLDMPAVGYYAPEPYVKRHLRHEAAALGGNCVVEADTDRRSPYGRGLAARVADPRALPVSLGPVRWASLVLYLAAEVVLAFTLGWVWCIPAALFLVILAVAARGHYVVPTGKRR